MFVATAVPFCMSQEGQAKHAFQTMVTTGERSQAGSSWSFLKAHWKPQATEMTRHAACNDAGRAVWLPPGKWTSVWGWSGPHPPWCLEELCWTSPMLDAEKPYSRASAIGLLEDAPGRRRAVAASPIWLILTNAEGLAMMRTALPGSVAGRASSVLSALFFARCYFSSQPDRSWWGR